MVTGKHGAVKRRPAGIFGLALALLLALGLSACGSASEEEQACQDFLEAYVQGDSREVSRLLGLPEESAQLGTLQSALAQRAEWELKEPEASGETARVPAVITNVDVEAVLEGLPEDIASVEEAREALQAAFEDKDAPMREFPVELELQKGEDGWQLVMTPELSDALLGGYPSRMNRLLEGGEGA